MISCSGTLPLFLSLFLPLSLPPPSLSPPALFTLPRHCSLYRSQGAVTHDWRQKRQQNLFAKRILLSLCNTFENAPSLSSSLSLFHPLSNKLFFYSHLLASFSLKTSPPLSPLTACLADTKVSHFLCHFRIEFYLLLISIWRILFVI